MNTDLETRISPLRSWVIIGLMCLFILLKGLYAFWVVGDLGQPDWDFGTIPDVPSESPYAVYELLPHPQHIQGKRGN